MTTVRKKHISEQGIVAKIFYPDCNEPRQAVIVLSGSDGGFHDIKAKMFAEEGFVSMALAYFHADGLPEHLEDIPLEYFENAITWLKSQPEVMADKIHLHGASKGGELTLVLASIYPDEFATAVALVPSCVTGAGLPDVTKASWTLKGLRLPAAPTPSKADVLKQLETRKVVDLVEIYLSKMQDRKAFESASIAVEKIKCPLLLISGSDDRMWPSKLYCEKVMQRLDHHQSSIYRDHICYEGAGHMMMPNAKAITKPIIHPVTHFTYEVGGTPERQAFANNDAWKRILDFMRRH
jgi:dienelactone hydrolase